MYPLIPAETLQRLCESYEGESNAKSLEVIQKVSRALYDGLISQ